MEMLRESGTGSVGVLFAFAEYTEKKASAECAEKKIKNCNQWQATNDGHKTCSN